MLITLLTRGSVAFSALPFMWRRSSDGPGTKQGQQHSKAKRLQIYVDIFRGFGKLYDITDSLLECIDDLAEQGESESTAIDYKLPP